MQNRSSNQSRLQRLLLRPLAVFALCLPMSVSGGCATIAGTAVSPITGGVDLCRVAGDVDEWYLWPAMFVGGAIAGPFISIYNGVYYDMSVIEGLRDYAKGFKQVFRPWQMVFDEE